MKRSTFLVFAWSLFILLITTGCNSINQLDEFKTSDDTMRIAIKQICYNEKYNFTLQFDSVINDSRCPYGVECFWEGNVQVKFILIDKNKFSHVLYLNSSPVFQNDTTITGINYRLIEVVPHPSINSKFEYSEYRATVLANTK
ncbi:MAG: hypothetical protein ACYC25_08495 [Paludibacter sp.]|jgi:hypothetical protein